MAGMLRVPRSRGALSGFLLVLLGLWGGLITFVGPYFHFAYTPDTAWYYSAGRLWLEILPGAATFLGGLILLGTRTRPVAMFGAWLAALGGAWFAVGQTLTPLWNSSGTMAVGTPVGSSTLIRTLEQISFFAGLGVVIVFLAATSIGRLSVIGVRDARLAEAAVAEREVPEREVAAPDSDVPAGEETEPVLTPRGSGSAGTTDGEAADQ